MASQFGAQRGPGFPSVRHALLAEMSDGKWKSTTFFTQFWWKDEDGKLHLETAARNRRAELQRIGIKFESKTFYSKELEKNVYRQRMIDNLAEASEKLKVAISIRSGILYRKRRGERVTRELTGAKLILAGELYWIDGLIFDVIAKDRRISLPKSTLTKAVDRLHLPTRPRGTLPFVDREKYDEWCEKVESCYLDR